MSNQNSITPEIQEEIVNSLMYAIKTFCVSGDNSKVCMKGHPGEAGGQGVKGNKGPRGPKGASGLPGKQGPQGTMGMKGKKGISARGKRNLE